MTTCTKSLRLLHLGSAPRPRPRPPSRISGFAGAPLRRRTLPSANDKTDKGNNQRLSLFLPCPPIVRRALPSPLPGRRRGEEKNQGTISVCFVCLLCACVRGARTSIAEGRCGASGRGGLFKGVMYFSSASRRPRRVHSCRRAHARGRAAEMAE